MADPQAVAWRERSHAVHTPAVPDGPEAAHKRKAGSQAGGSTVAAWPPVEADSEEACQLPA